MKKSLLLVLLTFACYCQAADINDMGRSIQEVKARHEARLMAIPGVVSVGIGLDEKGNPAIVIGIDCESRLNELLLPEELESFPVKINVTGTVRAQ